MTLPYIKLVGKGLAVLILFIGLYLYLFDAFNLVVFLSLEVLFLFLFFPYLRTKNETQAVGTDNTPARHPRKFLFAKLTSAVVIPAAVLLTLKTGIYRNVEINDHGCAARYKDYYFEPAFSSFGLPSKRLQIAFAKSEAHRDVLRCICRSGNKNNAVSFYEKWTNRQSEKIEDICSPENTRPAFLL